MIFRGDETRAQSRFLSIDNLLTHIGLPLHDCRNEQQGLPCSRALHAWTADMEVEIERALLLDNSLHKSMTIVWPCSWVD